MFRATGEILNVTAYSAGDPATIKIIETPNVAAGLILDFGNSTSFTPADLKGVLWTTTTNEIRQYLASTNQTKVTSLRSLLPADLDNASTGGLVIAQGPNATNKLITTNLDDGDCHGRAQGCRRARGWQRSALQLASTAHTSGAAGAAHVGRAAGCCELLACTLAARLSCMRSDKRMCDLLRSA